MIDAVAVHYRSLKGDGFGETLAERFGDRGITPDRQQRFRQSPQRGAEMDVAGKHDVRRAQPRRRRDDALANARRIDADDRRILEDAHACAARYRGEAVGIFAAVDLKRLGIIDAVEVAPGPQLIAYAIDLPAFDFGFKILAKRLQPADQRLAGVDIGDFKRALSERDARDRLFRCGGADMIGAFLRQSPQFAGVFQADPLDQVADRNTEARHRRAEMVTGRSATVSPARPAPTMQISTSRSNDRRERTCGVPASGPLVVLVEVSFMSFLTNRRGACHLVLRAGLYINPRSQDESRSRHAPFDVVAPRQDRD